MLLVVVLQRAYVLGSVTIVTPHPCPIPVRIPVIEIGLMKKLYGLSAPCLVITVWLADSGGVFCATLIVIVNAAELSDLPSFTLKVNDASAFPDWFCGRGVFEAPRGQIGRGHRLRKLTRRDRRARKRERAGGGQRHDLHARQ